MKFVSLFAGIGGIDLGLERAGHECVGQVEIDEYATKVLERHWPDTPRIRDVRDFHGHEFGHFDMLVGGYPCQPFSLAGSRKGERDERHLWPEVHRILRNVRPKYLFVENVTGHLSLGFGRVLGDLAESGYDAEWDCIPAAAVGANHRRDRVFIIARRRTEELADADSFGCVHGQVEQHAADVWEYAQCDASASGKNVANAGRQHGQSRDATYLESETSVWSDSAIHIESSGAGQANVANTDYDGFIATEERQSIIQGSHTSQTEQGITSKPAGRGRESREVDANTKKNMANASGERRKERDIATSGSRTTLNTRSTEKPRSHWAIEPDVGRVADGIPKRLDRLRGLGNAVVPQVAEWIGWRLPL